MKLILNGKKNIVNLAKEITWSGDIELAARTVCASLAAGVQIEIGDTIEFAQGSEQLFTGTVMYAEAKLDGVEFEAMDKGVYLAQNYVSKQYYAKPQEITRRILDDLGLKAGSIASKSGRENVISVGDMTAFAVIRKAYDGDGKREYVIRSEKGKICVRKISTKGAPLLEAKIIDAKKSDSIKDMVNRVLILDSKTRHTRGQVQNASDRAKYGTFTRTYTEVSTKSSSVEAAKKLRSMERAAKVTALDDMSCIAGEALRVTQAEAGLNGTYVIGADRHIYNAAGRTMVLQLIV